MFAFKGSDAIICSAMAEEVGSEVRIAGDRARRRRLNKLSCAGWVPHDRGFVSGLPRSKDERRSGDRLITGREGSPPRPCRRQCAPLNLLASASFSCFRQVQQFGHGAGRSGGEPPVSVAAVATGYLDRLQLLEVEIGNGLQLLRSLDPSRLADRLSSQARYSSCKVINVATAAAQRCGRDGGRRAGWAGGSWCFRRSGAQRRAWRWAGVIGSAPMRGLSMFSLLWES
jgi:hypothetical protein